MKSFLRLCRAFPCGRNVSRRQGDEDDPETGVQSSFRVERPSPPRALTLFRLKEVFPFVGTFHFRLKVRPCACCWKTRLFLHAMTLGFFVKRGRVLIGLIGYSVCTRVRRLVPLGAICCRVMLILASGRRVAPQRREAEGGEVNVVASSRVSVRCLSNGWHRDPACRSHARCRHAFLAREFTVRAFLL